MTIKSCNAPPAAALILAGLFIFGIGIAANYTYMDEVYFADPVINYLHGDGYRTSAWNQTTQSETHVSTAPAYSLALLLWLKLFGISQTAARCLPATLALGSALVFWRACVRFGLIKSGPAGVVLICVLICDYGYAFSYTCGRPDALSALLVAGMFYFSTLSNKRLAIGLVCLIALLLPFVQWGCVIYVFVLSLALLIISRKHAAPYVLPACACLVAGLLLQKMIYTHLGLWDIWMNAISKSEGPGGMLKRIGSRMTLDALLHHNSNTLPKDFSVLVILAGLVWVYFRSRFYRRHEDVLLAKTALVIAAVIIVGMYILCKFPTYYGWMLSFPLAAVIGAYFDRAWPARRLDAALAAGIVILACGVGLPLQAGLASHDWRDRNPAPVTAWLGPKIGTNDVVYCDYPFYYIAKERARHVYAGFYFNSLTREEINSITLVIIADNDSGWNKSVEPLGKAASIENWQPARSGILGNNWKYGILSAPNYGCTVYRLKGEGAF